MKPPTLLVTGTQDGCAEYSTVFLGGQGRVYSFADELISQRKAWRIGGRCRYGAPLMSAPLNGSRFKLTTAFR